MSGILNVLLAGAGYGEHDALTLTPGTYSDADESEVGYRNYVRTYGSVSSTALSGSTTLLGLYHTNITVPGDPPETTSLIVMRISGFGADPGIDYLRDLVIDGNWLIRGGTSPTYAYSSGAATWTWGWVFTDPFLANPSDIKILY